MMLPRSMVASRIEVPPVATLQWSIILPLGWICAMISTLSSDTALAAAVSNSVASNTSQSSGGGTPCCSSGGGVCSWSGGGFKNLRKTSDLLPHEARVEWGIDFLRISPDTDLEDFLQTVRIFLSNRWVKLTMFKAWNRNHRIFHLRNKFRTKKNRYLLLTSFNMVTNTV